MHLRSARIHNRDQRLSLYQCTIDYGKMGFQPDSPTFPEHCHLLRKI